MDVSALNRAALEQSKEERIKKARTRRVTVGETTYTLQRPPIGVILGDRDDPVGGSLEWSIRMACICMGLDPTNEEDREDVVDIFAMKDGYKIIDAIPEMLMMLTSGKKVNEKASEGEKARQEEQAAQEDEERPLESSP